MEQLIENKFSSQPFIFDVMWLKCCLKPNRGKKNVDC